MSEPPELPPRPLPPRGVVAIVGDWLRWIGTARLIASALSVLIVVGGAWWLLRAPAPLRRQIQKARRAIPVLGPVLGGTAGSKADCRPYCSRWAMKCLMNQPMQ